MKPKLEDILPSFPHAIRLYPNPALEWDDVVARDGTIGILQDPKGDICVEEKIDGANVGICLQDGHPKIRNKERMLKKGESAKTASKKQFSSIWNWFYKNQSKFKKLEKFLGPCTVYGEWMWMQHGMEYDQLPSWFIAFDVYDHHRRDFLSHVVSRNALDEAGFTLPKRLDFKTPQNYSDYVNLTEGTSEFTTKGEREGICIKVSKGDRVTHRFKMVRAGFVRGALFQDKVVKNRLAK